VVYDFFLSCPQLVLYVIPLASNVLAESATSSKDKRKKQIFFFSLGLIHSWRAVRSQLENGRITIYISA